MIYTSPSRIDTNNANAFQNDILVGMQSNPEIIVDMKNTEYASSAALRALLIALKTSKSKNIEFKITNVSESVYEIFKTTGFDGILPIEK